MDHVSHPEVESPESAPVGPAEQPLSQINTLLSQLDETADSPQAASDIAYQDRLVQSRLGVAGSLFTALRCKHAGTASHSLRVALGCSSWGIALGLSDEQLDDLEIGALLHDVGKIGVAERILSKPDSLNGDDIALLDRHRRMGKEILCSCSTSQATLEVVEYAPAWYDGSKQGFDRRGTDLPLGARMVSIVDAFDAMTTDRVYRRALPVERALTELFECAGTQFDPELVTHFANFQSGDQDREHHQARRRWLHSLSHDENSMRWQPGSTACVGEALIPEKLFHQKLLDNIHDAVIYIDANLQIVAWNRGAERLTGISSESVFQKEWTPALVEMHDENGNVITAADCPLAYVIQTGVQALRRLQIRGRNGRQTGVDFHALPVVSSDGVTHGAALSLHDVSSEITLEERCQSLHDRATKDPLTQVANRAEFDRVHESFVQVHLDSKLPCSMIICDLDRFKSINDTYGHQAGDAVIKSFGSLLKSFCQPGDLVARYGGEEFVLLCADCTNAAAFERAEKIRVAFERITHDVADDKVVTACFGVTEIQPGDTSETMLNRADRALLTAKDMGRNRVVQLGTGVGMTSETPMRRWWRGARFQDELRLERELVAMVPIQIAIEKLRGFVADHSAQIVAIEDNVVQIKIDEGPKSLRRRNSDRPIPFLIELALSEHHGADEDTSQQGPSRTRIRVVIQSPYSRNRRARDVQNRAERVLVSLRSYLMARDANRSRHHGEGVIRWAIRLLSPWTSNQTS